MAYGVGILGAGWVAGEYVRVFDDERVRIVVSCTPPNPRPEHIVRAAETGRHVVIEKPIALTMAEVETARRAVAKAGVRTVTSFVLRRAARPAVV